MKKYLVVTLLAIVMLFPSGGALAKAKNSSAKKDIVRGIPENEHINAFRVDKIIGSGVINLDGEPIGTIDDLVIDIDDGSLVYAAIKTGGFLGFGEKLLAVPWQSLTAVPAEGIFIINQSKAKLEKASSFNANNWPDVGDKNWRASIYEFYHHHLPSSRNAGPATGTQKQQKRVGYKPYPANTGVPYYYPSVWQNIYGEMFDPQKIETVTGKIVKVEYSKVMKLIVYTDMKKPVLVALGPAAYFESQEKILQPGDKISVTGSRVVIDDTPFLIATKITEGNEELQVRDSEGHPIWIGWRQIK
ncbi:MAG: PRC-barrel domain-containing protein [Deltaproteobacteria bacterium]|jgi:sporulation protein YlmC with PRC-barrel domain